MPQITTIRVVRRRSVQPEQFGSAAAEVELTGNVLEGEDPTKVARDMLVTSRALVYENLGMKLPKSAVEDAKELDTPEETATVETSDEEPDKEPAKKRGPGRPKGSKNTAPKKGSAAAKAKEEAAKEADSDIPGDDEDDKPQISTNPEDRRNPEDDVPGDDDDSSDESIDVGEEETEEETSDDFTAEDLHNYIISQIKAEKLTTQQAKQMQREMKVVRVRDLDTPEKLAKAKSMIDSFIKANEAK